MHAFYYRIIITKCASSVRDVWRLKFDLRVRRDAPYNNKHNYYITPNTTRTTARRRAGVTRARRGIFLLIINIFSRKIFYFFFKYARKSRTRVLQRYFKSDYYYYFIHCCWNSARVYSHYFKISFTFNIIVFFFFSHETITQRYVLSYNMRRDDDCVSQKARRAGVSHSCVFVLMV